MMLNFFSGAMGRIMNRRWAVWLCLTALIFALISAMPRMALSRSEMAPARGTLLVAGEGISDPRFRETVILLISYDAGNVVGLILNRPTPLALAEALPEQEVLEGRRDPLYYGGPVEPELLLTLLLSEQPPPGSTSVTGRLHVTGLPKLFDRLDSLKERGEKFRTFMGYAGWSPGQLAGEIARGDWYIEPFEETAVFDQAPETLWRRLRQGAEEVWI